MKRQPLKSRIQQRINRAKRVVFLRSDFEDLGGYDQVGRALRQLEKEQRLQRIAYGVYAKAEPSPLSDKALIVNGFGAAAKEALTRLGVDWEPGSADVAYREGRTTQVPARASVKIKGRFSRKIQREGVSLIIEKKD